MNGAPRLIEGGIHRDRRGVVAHVNAFDFARVDRFYTVSPANSETRGWVGHKRDWKWLFTVSGAFTVGVVKPDNWDAPSRSLEPVFFSLDSTAPAVLEVPPCHFVATRSECADSQLLIFSAGRIEDAASDDFRVVPDYWRIPPR